MSGLLRSISLAFSAGAVGGGANALAIWLLGSLGVMGFFDVAIPYRLPLGTIYSKVVWGGVWGLVFLLPLWKRSTVARGFILSLAPTAVQLFYIFPERAGKGMMGLDLGALTPVFVVIFNAAWGIAAALWLKLIERR